MKFLLFSLGSSYSLTQSDTPITKVVTLLNQLKGRIDADDKSEQLVYNRYSCWCETTTKRKADAIHKGRDDISTLGTQVLELKAKVAKLASEIKADKEKKKETEEALAGLIQLRKKNHENFLAVKAELEHAIEGLSKAITVLTGAGTKHVMLQSPEFVSLSSTLRQVVSLSSVGKRDLKLAQELVSKFTPTADDGSGTYSPQSATIIGILKNMHENFVADLKEATETEQKQVEAFEAAAETYRNTIATLQESIVKNTAAKAETATILADTNQQLVDTTEQLNEDVEFFDQTKAACKAKSDAWTKRQKNRDEELKGIKEALKLLTSDETRALFNKSIKPGQETISSSFLQYHASRAPRNKAFKIISHMAAQSKSLRLAALAATVRTGRFGDVIKEIDAILKNMTEENETDIENRDECQSTTHKLNEENKENKYDVRVREGVIAKKERTIAKHRESIAEAIKSRKDARDNLANLTEQRENENAAFKQAKNDDEQAIGVLDKVLESLSKFWKKDKKAPKALAQEPVFEVSEDQAPDATFSDKGHREGESKGIISMLEMIQGDLKNEIAQGIKDEAEAQTVFQEQRDSINNLIDALDKKETSLEVSIAAREGEISDQKIQIGTRKEEIADTDGELAGMKEGCDWLIKNFSMRAEKRTAERNALMKAKGVLAGAEEVSLIAKRNHAFDDEELPSIRFSSLSFLQKK